jgi:hypothetical protein
MERQAPRLLNQEIWGLLRFVGELRDPALSRDQKIKNYQFKRHKALRIKIEKGEEQVYKQDIKEYLRLS